MGLLGQVANQMGIAVKHPSLYQIVELHNKFEDEIRSKKPTQNLQTEGPALQRIWL
jgi:hypothetical protein